MFTGLTSNTKKHIQLDAGALYKNYVVGTDIPGTSTTDAKLIGATEGGGTMAIVPEVRQIAVDGAKGPVKGFERIDSWTATLSTNVKEVTADSVKMSLGAATVSTPTAPNGYKKITPDADFDDADYLTNITWIGKVLGSESPMMIVFKNALCLNGFNFAVKDKGEGVVPVVLTAHYEVATLDEVPVDIYIPDIA